MTHPSNGETPGVAAEILGLQDVIGHLSKQLDADHTSNNAKFTQIQEKLDIWIKMNHLLLESNQKLLQAVLENSQETHRSTQSFERGSQYWQRLESQLKSFEQVTAGLSIALTTLRQVWERQTVQMVRPEIPPSPLSVRVEPKEPTKSPMVSTPQRSRAVQDICSEIAQSHRAIMAALKDRSKWLYLAIILLVALLVLIIVQSKQLDFISKRTVWILQKLEHRKP